MAKALQFTFERHSRDGGLIRLDGVVVAEIKRLELRKLVSKKEGASLISDAVGVPLYWRQYGDHQNPERRANYHRSISAVRSGERCLQLRARGLTRSRGVESVYAVTFRVDEKGRISCEMKARLEVQSPDGWLVTPHPDHGEVTFCTLWPKGVFSADGRHAKRFQFCLVKRGEKLERIEHHHLESPDKHHIRLRAGDRFGWALEEENPVLTMGKETQAEAGLCAYMWDAHFGVKICREGKAVTLPKGTVLEAGYLLSVESKTKLRPLVARATTRSAGAALRQPVWAGGRHSFQETFRSVGIDRNTAWPWQTAVAHGDENLVRFTRDTKVGHVDRYSLKVENRGAARSCWQATTLGPAFGEPAFRTGGRLQLKGMVKLRGKDGCARVIIRLHRSGRGSVYAVSDYECYPSSDLVFAADQGWRELGVTTPRLRPAPDRVHVLLELEGRGTAWFDEVELMRMP